MTSVSRANVTAHAGIVLIAGLAGVVFGTAFALALALPAPSAGTSDADAGAVVVCLYLH